MTPSIPRWSLVRVEVRDLLGYQGEQTFDFRPGLQVVDAPNHTGKSSLALGLLWGLTGAIPKLDRLNLKSFRLKNKHAGENAETSVTIHLGNGAGQSMVVRRHYAGRSRDVEGTVEVAVGDEVLVDSEADARILQELGLKPASLEGCGVVLQDHRLKLVTGKDSEISDVVNDMLGLETLSETVPVLEDMASEADALRKEIEAFLKGGDPLHRWQEADERLAQVLKKREDDALASGFDPSALEDAAALLRTELSALAEALDLGETATLPDPRQEIERLRRRLGHMRSSSPHARELADVSRQQPRLQAIAKSSRKLADKWREQDEVLQAAATQGELDPTALARTVAELDETTTRTQTRGEEARGEQELLNVAYAHLLGHPDEGSCPVCGSRVDPSVMRLQIKERLDVRLASEIEQSEELLKDLRAKRKKADKRLAEVKDLLAANERLTRECHDLAEELGGADINTSFELAPDHLFARPESRAELIGAIDVSAAMVERAVEALKAHEAEIARAHEEMERATFQPLETRLNRARDFVVPLLEAAADLESHGRLRDIAEKHSGELEKLQREARDLTGRLKKIAAAVSEEESERASAAVQARLPFVSAFFARVAANPDFTGLDVQTTVTRNKVTYTLRATSSKMSALGDVVGHVLSEGDMSVAGMALLLGLASGDSHRTGFILLDDPAQGMDPNLQRNFAHELAGLQNTPQAIILTHQPDFAAALEAEGATRTPLGHWRGGRLHND